MKNAILGGGCEVHVYADGATVSDNEVAKLSVSELAAVELYAGGATAPVQYNRTGASRGVLLLDPGALSTRASESTPSRSERGSLSNLKLDTLKRDDAQPIKSFRGRPCN